MSLRYIDAHCHVQFEDYDADREAFVARMREEGVGGIVVGCSLASSRAAVALAEEHAHLWAVIGQHPTDTGEAFDADAYRALAASGKVVAIGECGLDYYRADDIAAARAAQTPLFEAQVALATELDLPLVIHARPSKGTMDAYHDIAAILEAAKRAHPNLRGDMHFFAGGPDEAARFVALGFTLSFTAVVTFARDYDAAVCAAPLESILAETDAPYVAPEGRRGKRNDPLAVVEVAAKIAEIRGEDPETVRAALLANTRRLFALPA
jgi:TatD DNase family protein